MNEVILYLEPDCYWDGTGDQTNQVNLALHPFGFGKASTRALVGRSKGGTVSSKTGR